MGDTPRSEGSWAQILAGATTAGVGILALPAVVVIFATGGWGVLRAVGSLLGDGSLASIALGVVFAVLGVVGLGLSGFTLLWYLTISARSLDRIREMRLEKTSTPALAAVAFSLMGGLAIAVSVLAWFRWDSSMRWVSLSLVVLGSWTVAISNIVTEGELGGGG